MYHINKEITGSGENIALKNTAKHYFKNFDILGNSVQDREPSMDTEVPVESVGDNINEFDISTVTTNKFVYADSGKLGASTVSITSDYIPVAANETYTALLDYETLAQDGPRGIALYDNDKKYISGVTYTSSKKGFTYTPTQSGYLRFSYDNNCTVVKFSKGTSTGAYSPYGQGSIEVVNCNGNFLKNEATTQTINGIKFTVNEDGTVIANGTATANAVLVLNSSIKINQEDMRIKGCPTGGSTSTFALGLRGNNNGQLIYDTGNGNNINATDTEYTARIVIFSGTTVNNLLFAPIITKGLAEYVPHQSQTKALYTQQPFRAVGDVKDRFVIVDGANKEQHHIKRIIADGVNYLVGYVFPTGYAMLKDSSMTNITAMAVKDWAKNGNILCNKLKTVSQADIQQRSYGGVAINNEGYVMIKLDDSAEENIWTTESINNFLSENPLTIDYELATPTLIPCTPEQIEQLESIEKQAYSYDEVTHIYSTDEVSPYFEVTAYQRISEEFKTRLKEGKITRGYLKVLATDTLPEIIINENNYLKDLKIEELRYVPEEGIIGGTVAKRVSGNFNNVDSSFDIQDREIEVYLGVELEDETTEYIKYGTYIVQRPEDDQVNDNTSFEALDYMIKFNQEYKDRITYPCTLKQLLDDIIDQAGVNSKVATFANSDFVVENNQFEQGSTLRDVLKAITQIAFNWSRIDADDNLVMDFETREETDEELGIDDYFSFKKSDDYGPVNVIVLRNSQVEGENVTIKNEELINSPSGYNELKITATSKTENGITFTVNEDGTVLVNGTATADTNLIVAQNIKLNNGEEYTLSGCPSGGNTTKYAITMNQYYSNTSHFIQDYGNGALFTYNKLSEKSNSVYIRIVSGTEIKKLTFKPMICKGNEKKEFQPYIPIGEIEYVISDNPFAYTELKRKQLIEAGRRLFGFKYTPMTVDMLGLMYLNSKDRISVENLNGQKYNTYLFDHTIDYTGIVLDSMESKSKSKTETKYQYVSSLAQGLSHVEIKVDKANKRIESIIESQEDVSEKVAKTVARIEVVYARSDSPTEAPTDGWSTTAPEWVEGEYMWQKTITTYANGSTDETAVTNISGAQGKDGVSGNNSYSYVAFANSADGSKDFSRTDSTNKTYIGTLTINESVNENLLKKTNQGTTNWGFETKNGVVSKEQYTEEGKNAVKLICSTASTSWQYASYLIGTDTLKRFKENTSYILSFDIKTNVGPLTLEATITREDSTNTIAQIVKAEILGNETWEHFSVQLKTISDFSQIIIGGQIIHLNGINKVGYYIIENLKLEEGYRETSYSKSPEDLANDYTQYNWQYTKGEEGVGVKSIIGQYYSSTSNTELVGGEWKETQDTLQTDRFIWTRSEITWTNGSVTYTDPILANTLNDINSNIIVFKDFKASQESTNQSIKSSIQETTKKLNDEYLTADKVNEKIDKIDDDYTILESRVAQTELDSKSFKVSIETIQNTGVDKIKTSMGYTFNDNGLNIDRTGSDTSTVIDEAKIKVTDKTGGHPKSLLYAGYVKEGDTEFSDYEGQTIVATSNLIVQNFLIIGSNSRFQDYYNETLGGNGTGAFDI